MEIIDLPIISLHEAPWNPNTMDHQTLARLQESIRRFGLVQNLVARHFGDGYEVLSGNQRLRILREMRVEFVPCVVVDLDDARAKLLAQALNRIQGEDDLGLKANLVKDILEGITEDVVLSLLPDSAAGLEALANLGKVSLSEHLVAWERAQQSRLRHIIFQVSRTQAAVIQEALVRAGQDTDRCDDNPSPKGNSLVTICRFYLNHVESGRASADE